MKKSLFLGFAAMGALALTACAPGAGVRGDAPVAAGSENSSGSTPVGAGSCDITGANWAVGKKADAATLKKIKSDSGAEFGRVIAPNQPVTMDFSSARVNVYVDSVRTIQRVTCG